MKFIKNISLVLFVFFFAGLAAGCNQEPDLDPTSISTTVGSFTYPSPHSTAPSTESTVPTTQTVAPSIPSDVETTAPTTIPANTTETGSQAPTMEAEHAHSFVESYTVAPSCTKEGYTLFNCSCGAYYTDRHTPVAGHLWSEWTVTKEATVDEEGETSRTCANCGETETQILPQLDPPTTTEPEQAIPPNEETIPETTAPTDPSTEGTHPEETEPSPEMTEPTDPEEDANPNETASSNTQPVENPEGENNPEDEESETAPSTEAAASEPTVNAG